MLLRLLPVRLSLPVLLIACVCFLTAFADAQVSEVATYGAPGALVIRDRDLVRVTATLQGVNAPTGVARDYNGNYIVRDSHGLRVFSPSGKFMRWLLNEVGHGQMIAGLGNREDLIAITVPGSIRMFSTTSSLELPLNLPLNASSVAKVSRDAFILLVPPRVLSIRGPRWLPVASTTLAETITGIVGLPGDKVLVASLAGTDYSSKTVSAGSIALRIYDARTMKLLRSRFLDVHGVPRFPVVIGPNIAVPIERCDDWWSSGVPNPSLITFLNLDLSSSSVPDVKIAKPYTVVALGNALLIGDEPRCSNERELGKILRYDAARRTMDVIETGTALVLPINSPNSQ